MARKKTLNLTHVMIPLDEDLSPTIRQLCPNLSSDPLDDPLDEAMASFLEKYKTPYFSSLDELLEASASNAIYTHYHLNRIGDS